MAPPITRFCSWAIHRFGGSHDPNGGGVPAWPVFTPDTERTLVLDETVSTLSKFETDERDFCDSLIEP
jgi:carboxylesterase type B